MQVYLREHEEDSKHALELSKRIPAEDVEYDSMSLQELEQELVGLDEMKSSINQLGTKYRSQIQQDNAALGIELAKHPHP